MGIEIGTVKLTMDGLGARLAPSSAATSPTCASRSPTRWWLSVDRRRLHAVAEELKELAEIAYDSCNFVAAVDYVTHLETVYHLYSYATNSYIELHVDRPRQCRRRHRSATSSRRPTGTSARPGT